MRALPHAGWWQACRQLQAQLRDLVLQPCKLLAGLLLLKLRTHAATRLGRQLPHLCVGPFMLRVLLLAHRGVALR